MLKTAAATSAVVMTSLLVAGYAGAAPEAPGAPGSPSPSVDSPPPAPAPSSLTLSHRHGPRLVAPVLAPIVLPPHAARRYFPVDANMAAPAPALPKALSRLVAPAPVEVAPTAAAAAPAEAAPAAESSADTDAIAAADAVSQSSAQLDKFHQIFQDATKIFGAEHTILSPTFFLAGDIQGRLSTTDKRQTGLSATIMLPLFGAGGGHGADWFPVVGSSDETQVYQAFLDQLDQFQQAQNNLASLTSNIDAIAQTKWNLQRLSAAKQIFCEEDVDPELPKPAQEAIARVCHDKQASTATVSTIAGTSGLKPDEVTMVDALSSTPKDDVTPRRCTLLLGPSLAIPLTKNPTDIFQWGGSFEVGGDAFRVVATGGLVGRYQGATYRDIFAAGWFAGLALSGQLGDELFHYFNGGSNLLSQLAQLNNTQPPIPAPTTN